MLALCPQAWGKGVGMGWDGGSLQLLMASSVGGHPGKVDLGVDEWFDLGLYQARFQPRPTRVMEGRKMVSCPGFEAWSGRIPLELALGRCGRGRLVETDATLKVYGGQAGLVLNSGWPWR